MRNHSDSTLPPQPLDRLVTELLECGGVLSQIVASMIRFEAAGLSDPDSVPIPEMAHSLILSVVGEIGRRYSKRDIRVASLIVGETTEAIGENLFAVDPEWIRSMREEEQTDHADGADGRLP